ncbi:N-acetylglucosamine-6-phosphate deacetylase [Thioclava sp. A2]|uniref:N-acetylglucosamine-6-phosphate deacetylase n=1 Tax=Thioclava sp. FCG-A2 TaxID=3080562 RepID=UPI00295375E3|nr:N-acetylglucosamine-6-phosphate deacetylase [Thioclava sp. A2]MDV7269933.1 N-acetylglucosamine-6-phosphate deacetylase [Thioclava sp. A2]
MTETPIILRGGPIFDGTRLLEGYELELTHGAISALRPVTAGCAEVDLGGDILMPGFVDLQVNGGGGLLFNEAQTVSALKTIAAAHRSLGTATILPTLITDRREVSRAAIKAAREAIAQGVAGIGGLHLEGPHLSVARKGAHDPDLIRPMDSDDLAAYCEAARTLPALMMTVAPETTTAEQVAALASAGAVVSLGHTDADYETCMRYQKAGARCVTHLFNAMSQLGNRSPGVVGATLDNAEFFAGLIADGHHVHPASIRAALRAKQGTERIFLVTDAMSPAGTDQHRFELNNRTILRENGILTLENGTLAGADLDLASAIRVMQQETDLPLVDILAMATRIPADLMGIEGGRLSVGRPAVLTLLSANFMRATPVDLA